MRRSKKGSAETTNNHSISWICKSSPQQFLYKHTAHRSAPLPRTSGGSASDDNLLRKVQWLELDEWFHAYLCSQACLPAQALSQHIIHNTEMLFPSSKADGNFHIIHKGRGKHFQVTFLKQMEYRVIVAVWPQPSYVNMSDREEERSTRTRAKRRLWDISGLRCKETVCFP